MMPKLKIFKSITDTGTCRQMYYKEISKAQFCSVQLPLPLELSIVRKMDQGSNNEQNQQSKKEI
jgi:hypothetical protein